MKDLLRLVKKWSDVIKATLEDPSEVLVGLMTRLRRDKRFKETFNKILQDTWVKVDLKVILNNKKQALIDEIHVQEVFIGGQLSISKKFRKTQFNSVTFDLSSLLLP